MISGSPAPELRLHGKLAELDVHIDISLTHSRTMAAAVAVLR